MPTREPHLPERHLTENAAPAPPWRDRRGQEFAAIRRRRRHALATARSAVVSLLLGGLTSVLPTHARAQDTAALWQALRGGGHVALMRHALAPGTGDPADFSLDDCATQRNLSDGGRRQAVRIGESFRRNGIERARVFSSQWCRCRETARLIDLGTVAPLPALNSFFQQWEHRDSRTQALRQWLATQDLSTPMVLVTHQVNITALTGRGAASGEIVVVAVGDGGVEALGGIKPD